jgi:hypothetical protein
MESVVIAGSHFRGGREELEATFRPVLLPIIEGKFE